MDMDVNTGSGTVEGTGVAPAARPTRSYYEGGLHDDLKEFEEDRPADPDDPVFNKGDA